MKTKLILLLLFLGSFIYCLTAQEFIEGASHFSRKKDSYFILKDGTKITGLLQSWKIKKGLIIQVIIQDSDGNESLFLPAELDHMYLVPSVFNNIAGRMSTRTNVNTWKADSGVNEGYIQEGYVLFESSIFKIKDEKVEALAQLINPGFSSPVKVYYDPLAQTSAGMGGDNITVAGGIAKSYYVKKGDAVAEKFTKKGYNKAFETIYDNCKELAKAYEKLAWRDFAQHLYVYSTECN